jgi:hypothetical protein
MSGRYRQLGPRDESVATDGDGAFIGVDMRQDPVLLQPGACSEAINKEFRLGIADTRKGFKTVEWAHLFGASFPWNFPIDFDEPVSFGTVYGACVFADPFGNEYGIIASENYTWQIAANAQPHVIHYPPGISLSGPVTFTQAFNVLIMWRGKDLDPIKLEVTQQFQTEMVWELVPDQTQGNYTMTIPDSDRGLAYGNRVWVFHTRSRVAFSDILAYTRYDPAFSNIWVNEGGSDAGVLLFPLGQNAIIAFKEQSIYAIENVLPIPTTTSTCRVLTSQHGIKAADSAVQTGADAVFLADDGVYAISQVLDNALQAGTDPISGPMQPFFDRVNWQNASSAQGIYHDRRYFLALPIDGETHNNAIAVFDYLNNAWIGWWEFDWLDALKLIRLTVSGRKRLFIVSGNSLDAANNGTVYMLGDGFADERFDEERDIQDTLLTRGYLCNSPVTKSFCAMEAEIATWYGAGSVFVSRDGINEEAPVLDYSKDRTRYSIFGHAPYDISNAGHNHADPYREDYSVVPNVGLDFPWNFPISFPQGVDFSPGINFPWDFPLDFTEGGIAPGLHQHSTERGIIRQKGRYVQVRINGNRGRTSVKAVVVYARANPTSRRTRLV